MGHDHFHCHFNTKHERAMFPVPVQLPVEKGKCSLWVISDSLANLVKTLIELSWFALPKGRGG